MVSDFLDFVLSKFSMDVGIDLGTANTPVIVKGKGVRLREPSFVSIDLKKNKVIAVGYESKMMYGRSPEHISVIRPLKDGVIANFDVVQAMISHFLNRVKAHKLFKPRVIVGVPTEATPVEKKAVLEASRLAGARAVYIIEQTLSAAIGAGLPVEEPKGSMIIDIGGGTTEAAVISLGGIVVAKTSNIAGDEMDEAIIEYVKRKHNLLIGERTAEDIKYYLGQAVPSQDVVEIQVRGRDLSTGLPKMIDLGNNEICEALQDVVSHIGEVVKAVLEITPPELSTDIIENGIAMAGGASQLKDLDKYLSAITGVKCYLAGNPQFCVVQGMNNIFSSLKLMKKIFKNHRYVCR